MKIYCLFENLNGYDNILIKCFYEEKKALVFETKMLVSKQEKDYFIIESEVE